MSNETAADMRYKGALFLAVILIVTAFTALWWLDKTSLPRTDVQCLKAENRALQAHDDIGLKKLRQHCSYIIAKACIDAAQWADRPISEYKMCLEFLPKPQSYINAAPNYQNTPPQ